MAAPRRTMIEGDTILRLSRTGWLWVSRRSDRIEFVDEMAVRRRTTVELVLSELQRRQVPRRGGHLCLPLATLSQSVDVDIVATDNTGAALHVFPRDQERGWIAEGIIESIDARFGCWPGTSPQRSAAIGAVRRAIGEDSDLGPVAGRFGSLSPQAQLVLDTLVTRSRNEFVVVVAVPDPGEHGEGLVATVVLEQLETADKGPIPDEELGPARLLRWRFQVEDPLAASSYHFDLDAPAGTCVAEASLQFTYEWASGGASDLVNVTEVEHDRDPKRVALAWNHVGARRAHGLAEHEPLALVTTDDEVGRPRTPVVEVEFRPLQHGLTAAGRFAAIASSLTLLALVAVAVSLASGLVKTKAWNVDENSIVTLLLIGPTLLIAVIVQREEHLMTRWIFRPFRNRLVVCGSVTGMAALWVALGATGWWLAVPLAVAAVTALWMTWLIERTYQTAGPRSRAAGKKKKGCACQMPSNCTGAQRWKGAGCHR